MPGTICNTIRELNEEQKREEVFAQYIIDNRATVRKAAGIFNVSKSTVHKDVTSKLKQSNYAMYCKVRKILEKNKSERHLRGGNATKLKYSKMKEEKIKQ